MAQSDFAHSEDKQEGNDHLTVKPKMWYGNQEACDLCKVSFAQIEWFADAKCWISGRRTWAIVCP